MRRSDLQLAHKPDFRRPGSVNRFPWRLAKHGDPFFREPRVRPPDGPLVLGESRNRPGAFFMIIPASPLSGVVVLASVHPVSTTVDRLESLLKEKGIMIFVRIDFSGDA